VWVFVRNFAPLTPDSASEPPLKGEFLMSFLPYAQVHRPMHENPRKSLGFRGFRLAEAEGLNPDAHF